MEKIAEGLKDALDGASDIVAIYTDLSMIPPAAIGSSPEKTLEIHAQLLFDAIGHRTTMFPAFNYGFARELKYDPDTSPAEVGLLNEHVRRNHTIMRTPGPLFNFAATRFAAPHFPPRQLVADPFGPGSILRWLIDNRATVLAYGAKLRYASALHVVERDLDVPYRYFKDFHGAIEGHGPYTAHYHVRPQIPGGVEYDWDKVDALLGPVFRESDSVETIRVACAHGIYGALYSALADDEHAFLKSPPTELYEKYGKPLTREAVEGPE